jgi:carbonic anhydrase
MLAIGLFAVALPLLGQEPIEPAKSWKDLEEGNERFIHAGKTLLTNVSDRMHKEQKPRITILSCADSRVPPELIFNQTIGDLFVVRTAGNVASAFDIASIEYAISAPREWTYVIVVMGHSACGAVEAAVAGKPGGSPSLDALLDRIRESFVGIGPWSIENLKKATEANARYSAQYLIAHSRIIRDAVHSKVDPVIVIPAYYDMETGKVTRLPDI